MEGMEREFERLEREMDRMMKMLERDPLDLLRDLEKFRGMGNLDDLMDELRREEEADEEFFAEPGTFGARVNPMDPVLRDQLGLSGEHGLWLEQIAKDGNAARMGLEEHDILLSIDGRPITGGEADVMKVLREQSAFGGGMKVELLRKGRVRTLSVPAEIIR
jgi:S1-C subfamily serine protease